MKNIQSLIIISLLLGTTHLSSMEQSLVDKDTTQATTLFDINDLLKTLDTELQPEKKSSHTVATTPIANESFAAATGNFDAGNLIPNQAQKELQVLPKAENKKTRKNRSTNTFEQRIIGLFQNKIVPIADGLLKTSGSKETQDLIETAKKKRLEFEKSVAAKISKSISSRPRSSYSGGSSSSSGWGSRSPYGSGSYGGYGSGGYGGYSPSSYGRRNYFDQSNPFNSQTQSATQETPSSDLDSSRSSTQEEPKEKDLHGSFAQSEEKESERALIQKAETYSATLRADLDKLLKIFREDKESVSQKSLEKKIIKLRNEFKERNDILASLNPTKQKEIKNKEKSAWNSLFWNIEKFKEKCQELVKNVQNHIHQKKSITPSKLKKDLDALIAKTSNDQLDKIAQQIENQLDKEEIIKEIAETKAKEQQPVVAQQPELKQEIKTKELKNGLEELIDANYIGEDIDNFISDVKSFLDIKPEEAIVQTNQAPQNNVRIKR